MSRPLKAEKEKRSKVVPPCRVTTAELAAIKDRAAQAGLSLSEYMRQMALYGQVIVREPLADVSLILKLDRIATSLHANANNVNQQTKNAHIFGRIDAGRFTKLAEENEALNARIDSALTELGM